MKMKHKSLEKGRETGKKRREGKQKGYMELLTGFARSEMSVQWKMKYENEKKIWK